MKIKHILGCAIFLLVIASACKKDLDPIQPQDTNVSKAVPADLAKKIVGTWDEALDVKDAPHPVFNRIKIDPANENGDGNFSLSELTTDDNNKIIERKHIAGQYYTYELNRANVPNIDKLEKEWGPVLFGLKIIPDDGSYFSYVAFLNEYTPDQKKLPTMRWLTTPVVEGQPLAPRVLEAYHE